MLDATGEMSKSEKKGAIEAALASGMEPCELFAAVVEEFDGIGERRGLVVHWGRMMRIAPSDAFRIAHGESLIPESRQSGASFRGKPRRKSAGKTSG